jgi:uncharacterized membrane protein (UPF0136 family)
VKNIRDAVVASLFLGAVMALGDVTWAAMRLQHRVAYGLVHGAVMCLCLGIAVGVRARKPVPAALAGPVIGVLAAAAFYLLFSSMRMAAMFPAWMLFWILFALLQQRLAGNEGIGAAAVRGVIAAILSGVAFYAISGIWTGPSAHAPPNVAVHFAAWSFAFLPGFVVLFWPINRAWRRHLDGGSAAAAATRQTPPA